MVVASFGPRTPGSLIAVERNELADLLEYAVVFPDVTTPDRGPVIGDSRLGVILV